MKKFAISIVLVCYLAVTCGFMVNAHYCMDQLASVHLFNDSPETCGQCGMEIHKSDGCCRDEENIIKLQQDQNKLAVSNYDIPAPVFAAITTTTFIPDHYYAVVDQRHFHNHSPPLLSPRDIYLENNVFRI
jgi:hypothetical protein